MKKTLANFSDFEDDDDNEWDEDESNDTRKPFKKKGANIFLIDARKSMFTSSFDDTNLPFIRCLDCVRKVVKSKIYKLENSLCSIILLGTQKKNNPLTLNGLYVVQELDHLCADLVMTINDLIKAVEDSKHEAEYGFGKFSLGDALWLCSHIFSERPQNLNKTIVLFTNDDNPPSDDTNDANRALTRATDMKKTSTSFELVQLGSGFDVNKFYGKIIIASCNDANYVIPDPVENVEDMVRRISKINYHHVTLVKIPFIVSDDFQIGVSVHWLIRKVKVPFKVKLSKATNERVVKEIQTFESDTGSLAKSEDLIKCQLVGLKDIAFRPCELKAIDGIGKPGLRLLGFKPASSLTFEYFVKPCAFLYPDDSSCKESSTFFTALMMRCIAKQVIAICTLCTKPSGSCRFVALIAQDEVLREDKSQDLPPGFVVFYLPFNEEVRTVELKQTKRADPEQVEIAMKLIKKLKFKYNVESFPNPRLKSHWAAIEALALDLKEPEEVTDSTVPNYDLIAQRTGNIAKQFMDSVYAEDYDPELFSAPKKPKAVKPKVNPVIDTDNVAELVRSGKGDQLSNDILKNYLISVGEGKGLSKMKKADLLEKIKSHLS